MEKSKISTKPHFSFGSEAREPKNIRPVIDLAEKNQKNKDVVLKIKINLNDIVNEMLVCNGYNPTEFTIEQLLDTMDSKKELKTMCTELVKESLQQHISYCIGFLDKPELQNTKNHDNPDGNLDDYEFD